MTERPRRLLVMGLDGATFDVIRPWVAAGGLPTFGALIETGASGTLNSTVPPLTPPAWVSSVTGVNPGKHGVFDFIKGKEQYRQQSFRSTDWKVEPVWLRLSREQIKVGVVNFPMTYPPFPVSGFMISGMMTPGGAADSTHPPELSVRRGRPIGRAGIRLDEKNLLYGHRRAFLKDLRRVTLRLTEVSSRLAQMFDVDLLHVVYDGPDRVQHYFWRFMGDSTSADSADARAIFDQYRCLDRSLAALMASLSPEYVIVYSDHGFGPLRKRVHIEHALAELGFLAWRSDVPASTARWKMFSIKEKAETLAYTLGLGTTLKRLLPPSWKNALPRAQPAPYQRIDWRRTKAFFASTSNQSIRINVKDREPQGIVQPGREYDAVCQQIIEGLLALRDPATGQPVVQRVDRREDVYHGPYVQRADDLIVRSAPGSYLVGDGSHRLVSDPGEDGFGWSGIHRSEGMIILTGPGVGRGQRLSRSRIEDIAPTMLYVMGVAVPEYMDGRVLTRAFEPEFLRTRPVGQCKEALPPEPSPSGQPDVEDAEVMARLKNLGYIE